MCGRVTITRPQKILEKFAVDFQDCSLPNPRYNVCPSQMLPIVIESKGKRHLVEAKWGVIPRWAKDKKGYTSLINARVETVHTKSIFRPALEHRHCLVPVDGFYEWKHSGRSKQAFYIFLKDRDLFGLAGLYEEPIGEDTPRSFCILTTVANEFMQSIHDRMPVILPTECCHSWLDASSKDISALHDFLTSLPGEMLDGHAVSPYVNSPLNEGEQCIQESCRG